MTDIQKLITEGKATIIDVRTPQEFSGGHVSGSRNIPLQELPQSMEEIKKETEPIILCCASGQRSGMATRILSQQGVECYNGGSWLDVNFHQSQKTV